MVLWQSTQQPAAVAVVFVALKGYKLEPVYVAPGASRLHDPADETLYMETSCACACASSAKKRKWERMLWLGQRIDDDPLWHEARCAGVEREVVERWCSGDASMAGGGERDTPQRSL